MVRSDPLTAISLRSTPDRVRCEAMGFALDRSEVFWTGEELRLTGRFRCVCGRFENFDYRIAIDAEALDPARFLREQGAFGFQHLVDDGYTPSEVQDILSKGDRYDVARN